MYIGEKVEVWDAKSGAWKPGVLTGIKPPPCCGNTEPFPYEVRLLEPGTFGPRARVVEVGEGQIRRGR